MVKVLDILVCGLQYVNFSALAATLTVAMYSKFQMVKVFL